MVYSEGRSGGHGYCRFSVLKVGRPTLIERGPSTDRSRRSPLFHSSTFATMIRLRTAPWIPLGQIPDLPPHGELYPQGTDETERSMPGQEFIPVEAIFTASSDGLMCVISRILPSELERR